MKTEITIKLDHPPAATEETLLLLDLIQRYLDHLSVRNYSPQTISSQIKQLRYFRQFGEKRGVTRVDQITRQCILDYQAHLFQQYRKEDGGKLAVSTQKQWLMAVTGFMAWITRQGLIHLIQPATSKCRAKNIGCRGPS